MIAHKEIGRLHYTLLTAQVPTYKLSIIAAKEVEFEITSANILRFNQK